MPFLRLLVLAFPIGRHLAVAAAPIISTLCRKDA
jgi:hypothetical protein